MFITGEYFCVSAMYRSHNTAEDFDLDFDAQQNYCDDDQDRFLPVTVWYDWKYARIWRIQVGISEDLLVTNWNHPDSSNFIGRSQ